MIVFDEIADFTCEEIVKPLEIPEKTSCLVLAKGLSKQLIFRCLAADETRNRLPDSHWNLLAKQEFEKQPLTRKNECSYWWYERRRIAQYAKDTKLLTIEGIDKTQ